VEADRALRRIGLEIRRVVADHQRHHGHLETPLEGRLPLT
jgi:hypothetical protein